MDLFSLASHGTLQEDTSFDLLLLVLDFVGLGALLNLKNAAEAICVVR